VRVKDVWKIREKAMTPVTIRKISFTESARGEIA
jgi:hypothetical protein